MNIFLKKTAFWLWLLLAVAWVNPSAAAPGAAKPFAENKIVLQISDNDPFKQTLVLNVANNLVKAYGTDNVDIQIVAFGPGLRLLFADNANTARIKSLADGAEVKFHACSNTINNMSKILGSKPAINALATTDSPGIVRIMDLVKNGYVLVKP
jgi:intracellular sulfur oxidation DsrE/DsrF family protein